MGFLKAALMVVTMDVETAESKVVLRAVLMVALKGGPMAVLRADGRAWRSVDQTVEMWA